MLGAGGNTQPVRRISFTQRLGSGMVNPVVLSEQLLVGSRLRMPNCKAGQILRMLFPFACSLLG